MLPVLPGGMSHWTEISPLTPSGTIALFALTMPGRKLIALAKGAAPPAGYKRKSPWSLGVTTAMMIATAVAEDGIPQRPATGKVRTVLADSAGPPEGPSGLRVSATRHGATVKRPAPTRPPGVGVLVGVSVGVAVGVGVSVPVGVGLGVLVGVSVGVLVGVFEGVGDGVGVRVGVGVLVGVLVGV